MSILQLGISNMSINCSSTQIAVTKELLNRTQVCPASPPGKLLWEWGYVTLRQLQELRFPPFGLPVERDILVEPGKYRVKDEVFMCRQYGRD